ncbi:hypothetical protein VV01_00005 [Luteipulveratus halotolerans]|uniref:Uncharacterized protein n=1 Tax=Luteipulveratus halotolerans TaxID=1631356 RepID=A0A0L6CPG8_9MICO|nr:hypothetical protein VV01_00005 [Luteipulveratus halotolerans]
MHGEVCPLERRRVEVARGISPLGLIPQPGPVWGVQLLGGDTRAGRGGHEPLTLLAADRRPGDQHRQVGLSCPEHCRDRLVLR